MKVLANLRPWDGSHVQCIRFIFSRTEQNDASRNPRRGAGLAKTTGATFPASFALELIGCDNGDRSTSPVDTSSRDDGLPSFVRATAMLDQFPCRQSGRLNTTGRLVGTEPPRLRRTKEPAPGSTSRSSAAWQTVTSFFLTTMAHFIAAKSQLPTVPMRSQHRRRGEG
jgi:hypothetical protein